jgi:hypothetical protein
VNDASAEIERIVRQVMAELQAAGTQGEAEANGRAIQPTAENVCTIENRVVTLETLASLNGAKVVRVRRGAVVTPAVRDELKARNIRLEFADVATPSQPAQSLTLLVGIADIADDVATVTSAMQAHAAGLATVVSLQNSELKELVRRMSEFIAESNTLGVVLSRRPAAAACLANRHENIRAVWACTPRALHEAMQTLAPNVITYNPADHAGFAQRTLLQAFLRGGKK